jgi:hypothetical protein
MAQEHAHQSLLLALKTLMRQARTVMSQRMMISTQVTSLPHWWLPLNVLYPAYLAWDHRLVRLQRRL